MAQNGWILESKQNISLSIHQLLHPRLAIATILLGDYENGWLCHFGLKCSTFTTVNCGTSGRTPCTPYGNTQYTSVHEGNVLASRTFGCFSFRMHLLKLDCILFFGLMLAWPWNLTLAVSPTNLYWGSCCWSCWWCVWTGRCYWSSLPIPFSSIIHGFEH